jgi:RimJ/RimL family protein N-acetyltransferase
VTAVHGRSPLLALRLLTPRLELRLPAADELPRFAQVARSGVHARHEMPFLVTWTDHLDSPSFVDDFVGYHLALRSRWTPEDWRLELGAWREGAPIGMQVIHAKDFRRERTTFSGSWLAQSFQRNGYGTEMRAAILELAFTGLGAVAAGSGALEGNVASARVSAKLCYTDAGERWPLLRGEPVREQRFQLLREQWEQVDRPPVEIVGLEPCLPLFGVSDCH